MSVAAIAPLRPVQGGCRCRCALDLFSVRVKTRPAGLTVRACVAFPTQAYQRRHQSQSSSSEGRDERSRSERPHVFFRQFVGRALGASLRNLAVSVSPRGIRTAYKDAPALTSMNIIVLALLAAVSAVAIRSYVVTFYSSDFSRYPEPVANTLRRAIYYTNYKPDAELALKYYKKAMEQVTEVGLDPFSDEVLGIRIQVASWLQKIDSYKASADVLESVLQDCKRWVAAFEQSVQDGKVSEAGRLGSPGVGATPAAQDKANTQTPTADAAQSDAKIETLWRKRQRLLAKAVGTAVKLGQLYANEHVLEAEKSHERLVWAVETSLKEFQRRSQDGPKPGEETWLSPTELGAMMESLGSNYERRSQFDLAVPLFFQALRVCDSPCHRAVIMNNLAACFAQQPTFKASPEFALPQTRTQSLEAALNWAQNAHDHANDVAADARTPECDEACAVALCNWADVAALLGRKELAQAKYRLSIDVSRKIAFPACVTRAQEGLARLTLSPGGKA